MKGKSDFTKGWWEGKRDVDLDNNGTKDKTMRILPPNKETDKLNDFWKNFRKMEK